MIGPSRLHRYTYADYVALEQTSPTKHEFLSGEIYAMAGRSEEHSALAAELLDAYRSIRSLQDYVIVSHRERRIAIDEVYRASAIR